MLPTFQWTTFDVTGILPRTWRQDVLDAAADADFRHFPRTPVISREAADVQSISRGRVHADQVARELPWLRRLYRSDFRALAERAIGGAVAAARDERYGTVLNVQRGIGMRFECHVDSNPLTGLLFCTDHGPADGGELVFSNSREARSQADIDRSCSVIRSQAGHLIFFDGRQNPHYVRPLTFSADTRVVAVMNYYLSSFPESTRPAELNRHLYGDNLLLPALSRPPSAAGEQGVVQAIVQISDRPVHAPWLARARQHAAHEFLPAGQNAATQIGVVRQDGARSLLSTLKDASAPAC